jgi:pyridoxal phosphate enzyme (YggS family)
LCIREEDETNGVEKNGISIVREGGIADKMIRENVKRLLAGIPQGVEIVAAAKTRSADEVCEAVEAGIKIIGENYVQEARAVYPQIGRTARWHFIGSLQANKVKKAVELFDMIETVDSPQLAGQISKRCAQIGKTMDILVEINSGREPQKGGVFPERALYFVSQIAAFPNVRVKGIMTMGPCMHNAEDYRPYFRETRRVFDELAGAGLPDVEMKYLSMGMSSSYKVAIEEGANIVRIGTLIFGER